MAIPKNDAYNDPDNIFRWCGFAGIKVALYSLNEE
jgi:hypothetical protein